MSNRDRQLAGIQPPPSPAENGNVRAQTHGFRSLVEIQRNPRTAAIADWIASAVPMRSPGDELPIFLLACEVERYLRGTAALDAADADLEATRILRRDLSTVANTIGRLANSLGMTGLAAARLGLDLSRTGAALSEHLREHYPDGDGK